MKKINIIIVMICLYPSLVFADITTLFNMDIYERELSVNTNTGIYSNELFIEQTALGGFNHIKFNLETRLYYRLYMYKNATNFLFKGTKADFGVENNFSLSSDMIGVFADIRPLSFFGVRISGYADFMFNIMNFGYAGFDSKDVSYSFDELYAMKKGNAFGYIINIAPYFIFKFNNFVLINNLNISYVNVGDKEYYYDPRTAVLHKKSEFELINDFFLLGRISLFYIGGYYGLTYLINSKHLSHKLGIAAMVNFKFLKESLLFNIGASAGLHVGLPYYNNDTFIELKMSLAYKIL
ncbi:toxin A [Brachyspira murdochii]|uniref:Toxin A n=1 Tax=Brachyspira murdochii TaxID=84378 RepID=A0ABX5B1M7_9SPIR|nr:toxin A [Brachyspira murdochii]PPS21134.1 toxin A [Brachyspira murdochii]